MSTLKTGKGIRITVTSQHKHGKITFVKKKTEIYFKRRLYRSWIVEGCRVPVVFFLEVFL